MAGTGARRCGPMAALAALITSAMGSGGRGRLGPSCRSARGRPLARARRGSATRHRVASPS
eukprot:4405088-Lingulodinium_polyedra.AAC.1